MKRISGRKVRLFMGGQEILPGSPEATRERRTGACKIEFTLTNDQMEDWTAGLEETVRRMRWSAMWCLVGALAAADIQYERELCGEAS